jgi:glutaminyl-tRNA synthetase
MSFPPRCGFTTSCFRIQDLPDGGSFLDNLNTNSLEVVADAKLELSLAEAEGGAAYQFERVGYFCLDPDSTAERLVFNRTLPLKDTWAKIEKKAGA